jgi:uncharacterized membrane protein
MTAFAAAVLNVGSAVRRGHSASSHLLYVMAFALSVLGVGVATYLTVVHYAHQPIACNGIGDCEYVNSSEYAKVAGVPVALMGTASYATLAALIAIAWLRQDSMLLLVAWAVALASFAFSMYLTWIELEVLEAICVYCVVSAFTMTALFASLTAIVWTKRDEVLE